MKEKNIDKTKKTVQFNPAVPEVTIPTLPVSFHSKKKNDEIVLRRLKELTGTDTESVVPDIDRASLKSRDSLNNEDSRVTVDRDFIIDCLCWHNEYRARHRAPALSISQELCEKAQRWANKLASTNEFYYRINEKIMGQNLFCCPANNLVTDLTGQEVTSYWYKEVKKYNFFKHPNILHTNVNTGHFTQMVWSSSRYFGVGKAFSKTGKLFVVAFYFPSGNRVSQFQQNVLPPIQELDGISNNNGEESCA